MHGSQGSIAWWLRVRGVLLAGCTFIPSVVGLSGCQLATPFSGPGYDPERGVTLADAGDTVTIGITNAIARPFKRAAFDDYTRRVIKSLPKNDGYVGHSVRSRILGNEVWTMTMWRDEDALNAFVRSDMHRAAMREGLSGVRRAKFLRMPWPRASLPPTWDEILARLESVAFVEYGEPAKQTNAASGSSAQTPEKSKTAR